MKNYILFIIIISLSLSCSRDSNKVQNDNLIIIKEKANLEYANSLIKKAFNNTAKSDNKKLPSSKLQIDTLYAIQKHLKNERLLSRIYRLNGFFYGWGGADFEKSNYFFDKADSIFLINEEVADLALTAKYRCMFLRGRSKEDEMERILLNALEKVNKYNDFWGKIHLMHELSAFYSFDMKDHVKGIYYGEKYFKLVNKFSVKTDIPYLDEHEHIHRIKGTSAVIDLILSTSYIATNKHIKAKKHLIKALPFFEIYKDYEKLQRIHLDFMKIYEYKKDYEKFNHHLSKYIQTNGLYNKVLLNNSRNAFRLSLNVNKELSDLKLIEQQSKLNKKISNKNIVIIQLLVIIIILSVLAIFYFLNRNKFLLRLNKIINQKNNNSIQLVEKLENIIDERKELAMKIQNIQNVIAKDLHDNFGNRLAGIISTSEVLKDLINSKTINTKKLNHFLTNLDNSTNQLVLDLKDLIWSNNAKNNKAKEISSRFKNITKDLSKASNIKIDYKDKFDKNYILPQLWNRQLLLVFKEAINNACKYSDASLIKTGLEINNNGKLKLFIIDNGKGFIIDDVKKSGLFNMQKRINSIDCNFNINSSKNNGTRVIIKGSLPYQ